MPPPKLSTAAGVAAPVALAALACTKSEPARSGPATIVAEPSPPAAAAAPRPACGTRATVFARAGVVATDLDLIVRSAPVDTARVGRIAAIIARSSASVSTPSSARIRSSRRRVDAQRAGAGGAP